MHFPTNPKTFMVTVLIILTLVISLFSFLPPVHAAVKTALTAVSPTSGTVGQSVSVNGTIETAGGNFSIFFDSTKVKNATRAIGYNFTTSFTVPQATYGLHNITLQDISANVTSPPKIFTVQMSYAISPLNLPAAPGQLQEGGSVQIRAQIFGGNSSTTYNRTITVTTPTSANYSATLQLTTNQSGTAENSARARLYYPTNFTQVERSTNYTGTYQVGIYKNATATGAKSSFFIGLTNATSYHRLDWVNIKAMNYTKPNEYANITIAFGNKRVAQMSNQTTNGEVIYNWQIPANASIGTYTLSVKSLNYTTGTVKSVPDVQNFTVPGFAVILSTVNLNHEYVGGVNATVYQIDPFNASKASQVATGVTKSDGNITYTLERGNYNVTAYWKNVQVNETALIHVQNSSSWTIICQLTRIALTALDGKTHLPLTFLVFVLNATYRTNSGVLQNETQGAATNASATYIFDNQLITANYTVGAYRGAGGRARLFNTTTLPPIPQDTKMVAFNIICPVLNLTIHAEDARQATLSGYPIKIYDYADGLYANATTDSSGNVTFSAAFGQYTIRLYNVTGSIVLNETIFTLVNASSLVLRSSIFNANLSVTVVDYLGQPIPNVRVKLEREGVAPMEVNTNGNGVAFFGSIIGGDSSVSVYVGGNTTSDTTSVYVKDNTAVTISLGNYVSMLGFIMGTSQFAVLLTFIVFIIAFALFLVYQRRKPKTSTAEPIEKKT